MARMTLLEMTKNILSAMDSDDVNSISDTTESLQVANTIIETYYELYAGLQNPSMQGLIELGSLADPAQPTTMKIPDTVKEIKWIRYDGDYVPFQDQEAFLIDGLAFGDLEVGKYKVYSDRNPTAWTTYDNEHIIFNGYNSDVDSVLQASKTICWGQYDPVYDFTDNAYAPYLKGDDYPGLLAEAKAVCFINYKQVSSSKEEQKSRRQRIRRQNDEWRANQRKPYDDAPNYGRKRYRVIYDSPSSN